MESELKNKSRVTVPILAGGIGTRIGVAAQRLGSRSSAYEVMGISSATLQRYIAEETAPAFEAVARLCLAAGVRMEWIATALAPIDAEQPATLRLAEPDPVPYKAPAAKGDPRELDVLGDAVRIVETVLRKHGIRERVDSDQFADMLKYVFYDLTRGAAEDAASAALSRIVAMVNSAPRS